MEGPSRKTANEFLVIQLTRPTDFKNQRRVSHVQGYLPQPPNSSGRMDSSRAICGSRGSARKGSMNLGRMAASQPSRCGKNSTRNSTRNSGKNSRNSGSSGSSGSGRANPRSQLGCAGQAMVSCPTNKLHSLSRIASSLPSAPGIPRNIASGNIASGNIPSGNGAKRSRNDKNGVIAYRRYRSTPIPQTMPPPPRQIQISAPSTPNPSNINSRHIENQMMVEESYGKRQFDANLFVPSPSPMQFAMAYATASEFPVQLQHQAPYTLRNAVLPTLEKHGNRSTAMAVDSKVHVCHLCNKQLLSKSSLRRHLRMHTGKNLHRCRFCGRGCADNNALLSHMRTHTGEKPFRCDICKRAFSQRGNRNRHRQSCELTARKFAENQQTLKQKR